MIVVYNLKDLDKFKQIFNANHPLLQTLKDIMIFCKESKQSAFICQIILSLFFDEYKEKFFSLEEDDELNDIYIKYFYEFSSIYSEALDFANGKTYNLLFHNLCLFNIKEDSIRLKTIDENAAMTGRICQNIIELIFSKEKYAYTLHSVNNNNNSALCYEIIFFQGILEKYIKKIRNEYGNIYNSIFRKEDFCNELIKVMMYSFGNSSFISAFCIIYIKIYFI